MRKILFQILGFVFISFLFLILIMKILDLSAEAGNQAVTDFGVLTSIDNADSFMVIDNDASDTKNKQTTWSNVQGSITKTGTITTGAWNAGAVTSSGSVTASTHTGSGATTYDAGGANAITIGSGDVTSVTVTTDGTGTGEVVFPNGSVSGTEITDSTVVAADHADYDWGDISLTGHVASIDANAIALATDTTGNYVATIADSGASEVTVANSGSENAAVTLALASTITRDTEWDTEGEVQTAWGSVNILLETEIDASSELKAIMDDETGSGLLVFGTEPTLLNVDIKNGATSSGIFRIYEDSDDGTNKATFQVPALTSDTVYILPSDDGDAGEQLQTNGSGTLSWESAGAGGGDAITVDGAAVTDPDFGDTGTVNVSQTGNKIQWDLDLAASFALTGAWDFGGATSVEIPNTAGNVTTDATGEIALDSTNKQLSIYDGTDERVLPLRFVAQGTFDLTAQWDVDSDLWLADLHADEYPNGITITKVTVDCTVADPTTELDANLMYCDAVAGGAFPGANPVQIEQIDTTTGNFDDDQGDTVVATGKTIFIDLDADPTDATTQWKIKIHYYINED